MNNKKRSGDSLRLPKRATKNVASRANDAARVLQPHSFYVPQGAELSLDKIAKLHALLDEKFAGIDERSRRLLLTNTDYAVVDYAANPGRGAAKEKIAKLKALGKAAKELSATWHNVMTDHNLRGSVGESFRQLPAGSSVADHLAARERFENFQKVLDDDLWHFIAALSRLVEPLEVSARVKDPALYGCVLRIARAWNDCVGPPTMSRNDEASSVRGRHKTPFQRWLDIALPRPPSDEIVRNVLNSLK